MRGLVSDAREGTDGGRVAARLTGGEGEATMFGVERAPHGLIKLMKRMRSAGGLGVRLGFGWAFAVHRK